MKRLLIAIFSLVSVYSSAQDYEYKIKQNKINKHASDFSIILNPVFADVSENNTVGGYSADVLFRLNTVMSFRGNYSGSYYNIEPKQESDQGANLYNGIAAGNYMPFQYFHGEISLYLFTDVYDGPGKISLPSEYRSGEKQSYFLELKDVNRMQQVGLRVGGGKFQNQLKEKGFEFHGVDESKPVSDITAINDLDNSLTDNYTTIDYAMISGGLTYERVNHLVVEVKDSVGIRSKRSQWMIYGDALYGLNMNIGDVLIAEDVSGNKEEATYNLGKFTELQEFGFRVGFEHNVTSKYGWSYGVELGSRPGTGSFSQRGYVSAKIGVSLNLKTLQY